MGSTISGWRSRQWCDDLHFLGSRSLSLSLSLCVFGNDLKVKFWLKILSGSKALILRSTKILFPKIHFPYATKHPHLRKSFSGSDLKPKQTQPKTTNSLNKINITTYFENLTVELYVLYVFNIHVKFCVNQILFTIWSKSLYFVYNFKLQKLAI